MRIGLLITKEADNSHQTKKYNSQKNQLLILIGSFEILFFIN